MIFCIAHFNIHFQESNCYITIPISQSFAGLCAVNDKSVMVHCRIGEPAPMMILSTHAYLYVCLNTAVSKRKHQLSVFLILRVAKTPLMVVCPTEYHLRVSVSHEHYSSFVTWCVSVPGQLRPHAITAPTHWPERFRSVFSRKITLLPYHIHSTQTSCSPEGLPSGTCPGRAWMSLTLRTPEDTGYLEKAVDRRNWGMLYIGNDRCTNVMLINM